MSISYGVPAPIFHHVVARSRYVFAVYESCGELYEEDVCWISHRGLSSSYTKCYGLATQSLWRTRVGITLDVSAACSIFQHNVRNADRRSQCYWKHHSIRPGDRRIRFFWLSIWQKQSQMRLSSGGIQLSWHTVCIIARPQPPSYLSTKLMISFPRSHHLPRSQIYHA